MRYLVVLVCLMDDIPMKLFAKDAEAIEFARGCSDVVCDECNSLGVVDQSDAISVDVIEFDADGMPVNRETVKRFYETQEVDEQEPTR